jgi:hypothetical protein
MRHRQQHAVKSVDGICVASTLVLLLWAEALHVAASNRATFSTLRTAKGSLINQALNTQTHSHHFIVRCMQQKSRLETATLPAAPKAFYCVSEYKPMILHHRHIARV